MNRPFLKWAGGKFSQLDMFYSLFPPAKPFKRLIEPFGGSGVVSLNSSFSRYILADTNRDLISTFNALCLHNKDFIKDCKELWQFNTPEQYYKLRDLFNGSSDSYERAMLFVYLNRHGFNGLCRYNKSGRFNVPYGKYKAPRFPEEEMKWAREQMITKNCNYMWADFSETFKLARPGDVVYCDPPYTPISRTSSFASYSADGFGLNDHIVLRNKAMEARSKGVTVLISNNDTQLTRDLYLEANKLVFFETKRRISCSGERRGQKIGEMVAIYGRNTEKEA